MESPDCSEDREQVVQRFWIGTLVSALSVAAMSTRTLILQQIKPRPSHPFVCSRTVIIIYLCFWSHFLFWFLTPIAEIHLLLTYLIMDCCSLLFQANSVTKSFFYFAQNLLHCGPSVYLKTSHLMFYCTHTLVYFLVCFDRRVGVWSSLETS